MAAELATWSGTKMLGKQIPEELLSNIAKHLQPGPPKNITEDTDPEADSCRRSLLALVKTCKAWQRVTLPFLYHTVRIATYGQLRALLSTLLDHKEGEVLALHIKVLVIVRWARPGPGEDKRRPGSYSFLTEEMGRIAALMPGGEYRRYCNLCLGDASEVNYLEHPTRGPHHLADSAFCSLLLCLTTKLEGLHVRASEAYAQEWEVFLDFWKFCCRGEERGLLHGLKRVALHTCRGAVISATGGTNFKQKLQINEHNTRWIGATRYMFPPQQNFSEAEFGGLEEIEVQSSIVEPRWWRPLCQRARRLRRITITWNERVIHREHATGFIGTFELPTNALEYLRLDVPYLYDDPTGMPTLQGLACQRLRALETAVGNMVPLTHTLEEWKQLASASIHVDEDFTDLVSLERLCLWVEGYDEAFVEKQEVGLQVVAEQLLVYGERKCPKLKSLRVGVTKLDWTTTNPPSFGAGVKCRDRMCGGSRRVTHELEYTPLWRSGT